MKIKSNQIKSIPKTQKNRETVQNRVKRAKTRKEKKDD